MYKVSVVIPVYNVEAYIVHCAESLFNQTLDDMQFIFVDDASQDNSIALLEQTLQRFPHRISQTIILHHPENKGIPAARATGLAHVDAQYVADCDSDDYVAPAMYAKLYEKAVQDDSDMVICGRILHYPDGREVPVLDRIDPKESLILNFLRDRLSASVWNRLTKTVVSRKAQFSKENFYEDWVLTAQLLTYAERVTFLDEFLYYHNCRRPMSITTDSREEVLEQILRQCLENYYLMHDFLVKRQHIEEKNFTYKKQSVRTQFLLPAKRWSCRKRYLQTFPEINFSLLFSRIVPFHHKVYHITVLLGLHLISKPVYNLFRK